MGLMLKILAPVLLIGIVFAAGAIYGTGYGAEKAQERHQRELNNIRQQADKSMSALSDLYKNEIDTFTQRLQEERDRNKILQQKEYDVTRELLRVRQAQTEGQGIIYETDVGTCNVNSEFDRLLNNAFATTRYRGADTSPN